MFALSLMPQMAVGSSPVLDTALVTAGSGDSSLFLFSVAVDVLKAGRQSFFFNKCKI